MSFRLFLEELSISKKLKKFEEQTICGETHIVYQDYFSIEDELQPAIQNESKLFDAITQKTKSLDGIFKDSNLCDGISRKNRLLNKTLEENKLIDVTSKEIKVFNATPRETPLTNSRNITSSSTISHLSTTLSSSHSEWQKDFEELKKDLALNNSTLDTSDLSNKPINTTYLSSERLDNKHINAKIFDQKTLDTNQLNTMIQDQTHLDTKQLNTNIFNNEDNDTKKHLEEKISSSIFSRGFKFFSSLFSKKLEKYEIMPTNKQASYVLYSMQSIRKIKKFLHYFPKLEDEFGCSATLAWSGIKNFNVPVQCYQNQSIGIVLDPAKVIVPQADIWGKNSGCKLEKEILKTDAIDSSVLPAKKLTTKFPKKAGYYRETLGENIFVTNHACYKRLPGKTEHIYHETGSVDIFAGNVFRKFFKPQKPHKDFIKENGVMFWNEVIAFSDTNPIKGLMITCAPSRGDALALAMLLRENPSLNLYLYNVRAEEHIMRYIENADARALLTSSFKIDFDTAFKNAIPYENLGENQKRVFKK
ncbi:MAG: hypothetical protein JO131_00145 [Gammaproteobacteria bacterium]|nr:hypothetical protein [Gammaproteobacteria bacterium]